MEEKSMRKMMNKVVGNMKVTVAKAAMLLKDKKGENYVDTAVKILIAVVIGALLLAGLYALFGDVVMPEEFRKCLTTPVNTRERRRKRVCPEMQLHRKIQITQRIWNSRYPLR